MMASSHTEPKAVNEVNGLMIEREALEVHYDEGRDLR
jgi:hypothetical protein